jgi:beta-glucosidase
MGESLRARVRWRFAAAILAMLALSACATTRAPDVSARPWMNRALDPDQRADLVLAEMTLDEKIALLHGPMAVRLGPLAPALPRDAVPSAGYIRGIPRLGIPPLRETDAGIGVANPRGVRKGDGATSLPSGLAVAATWSPDAAFAVGSVIGREARDKGFSVVLGGAANLVREPRGGRNFEYPGEDPLLGGMIAGHAIRGVQSENVISTTKHFALNAQETGRQVLSADIDKAAFRESDLLLFEIALEIGDPGAVMCAYNRINGDYACGDDALLNKVLKRDWGFKGWVLSDWGAVHDAGAVLGGLDQESGQQVDPEVYFDKPLRTAVAAGRAPKSRIDDMAHRILRTMFRVGVVDDPPTPGGASDYKANGQLAQHAAEESIVLLKNEGGKDGGGLLPLGPGVRSIAVIGGHADKGVLSGGGSSQVLPAGGPALTETVSYPGLPPSLATKLFQPTAPLDALRAALPSADVRFADGADVKAAAALAESSDAAIIFATQWSTEFIDTPGGLALQDNQDILIDAVAKANPHTVVVLETGGPVLMPWLPYVPAVLEAWYPGTSGAPAIARVLTGVTDPAGRLPITFPASVDQLPHPVLPGSDLKPGTDGKLAPFSVAYTEGADVGYRWFDKRGLKPLFAFGHGLSYTSFVYGGLAVRGGEALSVSFDVTNAGKRAGSEVAQIYIRPPQKGEAIRLGGFAKITLGPGETRRVTVTVDPRLLAHFDASAGAWRIHPGAYEVRVGRSAVATELRGSTKMEGRRLMP